MEQLVDQYRDWSLAVGKGTTQVSGGPTCCTQTPGQWVAGVVLP